MRPRGFILTLPTTSIFVSGAASNNKPRQQLNLPCMRARPRRISNLRISLMGCDTGIPFRGAELIIMPRIEWSTPF